MKSFDVTFENIDIVMRFPPRIGDTIEIDNSSEYVIVKVSKVTHLCNSMRRHDSWVCDGEVYHDMVVYATLVGREKQ